MKTNKSDNRNFAFQANTNCKYVMQFHLAVTQCSAHSSSKEAKQYNRQRITLVMKQKA